MWTYLYLPCVFTWNRHSNLIQKTSSSQTTLAIEKKRVYIEKGVCVATSVLWLYRFKRIFLIKKYRSGSPICSALYFCNIDGIYCCHRDSLSLISVGLIWNWKCCEIFIPFGGRKEMLIFKVRGEYQHDYICQYKYIQVMCRPSGLHELVFGQGLITIACHRLWPREYSYSW